MSKKKIRTGLQFLDRRTTELAFPSVWRGLAVVPSAGTVSGHKMGIEESCAFLEAYERGNQALQGVQRLHDLFAVCAYPVSV